MNRIKRLTLEVRMNRIIIGSMLVLFSINTTVSPLGGIAVVPLIGAILVLSGILDWKPVPELFHALGWRKHRTASSRNGKIPSKARLAKMS